MRVRRELATSWPADYERQLAISYQAIGAIQMHSGLLGPAEQNLMSALDVHGRTLSEEANEGVDRSVALVHETLGLLYKKRKHFKAARVHLEVAKSLCEVAEDDPDDDNRFMLAGIETNLGSVQSELGNQEEAERSFEEACRLWQQLTTADPTDRGKQVEYAWSLDNLAKFRFDSGASAAALESLHQSIAVWQALSLMHPDLRVYKRRAANGYVKVSGIQSELGNLDAVTASQEKVLSICRDVLGHDDPETLQSINQLAVKYWQMKRLDRSIPLFEESLKLQTTKLGESHPDTLRTMANLGVNYADAGRMAEAISLLEAALNSRGERGSPEWVRTSLLEAYFVAGQTEKALALIRSTLPQLRATLPENSASLANGLFHSAQFLVRAKVYDEAEPLLRESLQISTALQHDGQPVFIKQCMLGSILVGQGKPLLTDNRELAERKFVEAESLLVVGYEGMKQRETTISANTPVPGIEAIQSLIELYTAWGKLDKAAEWRQRMDKVNAKQETESD